TINAKPSYQVPLAHAVRQGDGIANMAGGLITEPRQAGAILAPDQADMIAIGRRLMFNLECRVGAGRVPEISGALPQRSSAHWAGDGLSGVGGDAGPIAGGGVAGGAGA